MIRDADSKWEPRHPGPCPRTRRLGQAKGQWHVLCCRAGLSPSTPDPHASPRAWGPHRLLAASSSVLSSTSRPLNRFWKFLHNGMLLWADYEFFSCVLLPACLPRLPMCLPVSRSPAELRKGWPTKSLSKHTTVGLSTGKDTCYLPRASFKEKSRPEQVTGSTAHFLASFPARLVSLDLLGCDFSHPANQFEQSAALYRAVLWKQVSGTQSGRLAHGWLWSEDSGTSG